MNRPTGKPPFWETAPAIRFLLPFVAGIVIYFAADGILQQIAVVPLCIAIIVAAALATIIIRRQWMVFLLVQIAFVLAGFSVAALHDVRNDAEWFGKKAIRHNTWLVAISTEPAERDQIWKLPVKVLAGLDGNAERLRGDALVYLIKDSGLQQYHAGDTLLLSGRWELIRNMGNPFEFDYASACRRNNLYFHMLSDPEDVRLFRSLDMEHAPLPMRLHLWCTTNIRRYVKDRQAAGLLAAMLIGDETELDVHTRDAFTTTGIVHLIAISGSNVMLFVLLFRWLLLWLRHGKFNWLKYLLALPLVWLYVLAAGAGPSPLRAAVMFSLLVIGTVAGRGQNPLNQLFGGAFIVLLLHPEWVYSVGFQLSFVAVLSIILFEPPIASLYRPKQRILKWVWRVVSSSIAAEVLIAPLSIYYFHNFPVLFVPANLFGAVFALVTTILGAALLGAAAFSPLLAHLVGDGYGLWATGFTYVNGQLAALSPAGFSRLVLSPGALLLVYAAITGFALLLIRGMRNGWYLAGGAVVSLLVLLTLEQTMKMRQDMMIVYNLPRIFYGEQITGTDYRPLTPRPMGSNAYALQNTHMYTGSWNMLPRGRDVHMCAGKTVLLFDSVIAYEGSFAVDVLLLAARVKTEHMAQIVNNFTPKTIVIGNNYTLRQQRKLTNWCAARGIRAHATGMQGAWVLGR